MFAIECFSLSGTLPIFVLINKQPTEAPNYRLQEHEIPQIRQELHSTLPPALKPVLSLRQNQEAPLDTVQSIPHRVFKRGKVTKCLVPPGLPEEMPVFT